MTDGTAGKTRFSIFSACHPILQFKESAMQFNVNSYDSRVQSYDWSGKQRLLVCDGALEHDVWDRLSQLAPAEIRDQFIQTLNDPRLLGNTKATPETFGTGWKSADPSGRVFLLGEAQRPRQEVHFGPSGRSGGEFSVKTCIPGLVEHEMKGKSTFGELSTDNIQEQILLP